MGESIVAGGGSAEVLEACEHAFDGVARAVEGRGEAVFPASIAPGRNVRRGSQALDLAADGIAVIALIPVHNGAARHPVEQHIGGDAVRHLSTGQMERERAAEVVGERVDFRRPPAARAADCLIDLPPFPPAALR